MARSTALPPTAPSDALTAIDNAVAAVLFCVDTDADRERRVIWMDRRRAERVGIRFGPAGKVGGASAADGERFGFLPVALWTHVAGSLQPLMDTLGGAAPRTWRPLDCPAAVWGGCPDSNAFDRQRSALGEWLRDVLRQTAELRHDLTHGRLMLSVCTPVTDQPPRPSDLIPMRNALDLFSVSRATLRRCIEDGRLRSYRPPGAAANAAHVFSEAEVARLYERRRKPAN